MNRPAVVSILCGFALAFTFYESPANAAWPSGGSRTLPGAACSGTSSTRYCAYVSDYGTFWGPDNGDTYVDYHETHASGGVVAASSCWQSYTGTSASCYTPQTTATSGAQDLYIPGFYYVSASADPTDYFYVELVAGGGDTIDSIYGVAYFY
jgi:hypothetical protein